MDISEFGLLGGEAWFYCNYTDKGDSIIGLEWFFSADPSDLGTPLLSYDPWTHGVQVNHKWNDRLNFQDKTTNTSFFISPLKREDQGIYRCTVIGDETITKEKFLEVYDPPDEKDGLKVIEDFKPLMIGETAIYTCQSSNSSPPAKLMWLINDNPAQKENIPLNLTLTDPLTGTSTSVLKIKLIGLTNLHGAKLVCRATMFRQQPKEWIRTIEVTTSIKKLSPFSNSYFPLPPNTLPEIYSNISMNTHDKSLLLNLGVNKMNTSFELLQNQTTKAIVEITTSGIIHNDETNTEDGIVKGQTLAPRLITNVDLFVTSPQSTSGDLFMNITTFSNDFNNHLIKNHSTMEMTTNNNLVTTALLIQNHMGNISFMNILDSTLPRNRTLENINMMLATGSPRDVSATAPMRNDMSITKSQVTKKNSANPLSGNFKISLLLIVSFSIYW
ncbi:uncharacterized protein LOC135929516 [Gordionus sp. m RMFG-2023]|uniref:uncharacterized protein LOC135929516 n=1 Tax=Gordionus sp. m RMFG-2023 TaxID=3053472 RepID=UPI0031FBE5BA